MRAPRSGREGRARGGPASSAAPEPCRGGQGFAAGRGDPPVGEGVGGLDLEAGLGAAFPRAYDSPDGSSEGIKGSNERGLERKRWEIGSKPQRSAGERGG